MQDDVQLLCNRQRRVKNSALASVLALCFTAPIAWGDGEAEAAPSMPQTVSDSSFSSEREAVVWRRDELKDIESLVRQLRFDLVNNQDADAAEPLLAELQERANAEHLLPAFIAGTHGTGSEARPAIWEEWDKFSAGFADLESKVNNLVEATHQEDYRGAARALSDVVTSCRSCHRAYRYN